MCYIRTAFESFIYQLLTPWDLYQSFISTTRQQLNNLGIQDNYPSYASWLPNHSTTQDSSPKKFWRGGHKIKLSIFWSLLQTPWRKKVSGILLTVQLVSPSILHQDQNITNFFALTGSMVPLTVKHNKMIDPVENNKVYYASLYNLYNMLCHNCTVKLHKKIHP